MRVRSGLRRRLGRQFSVPSFRFSVFSSGSACVGQFGQFRFEHLSLSQEDGQEGAVFSASKGGIGAVGAVRFNGLPILSEVGEC